MLALLLGLEEKAREAAKIFTAYSLVHGCTAANTLAIVVCHIGPPISLLLHVPQDHVLNWGRQPRHLCPPRQVSKNNCKLLHRATPVLSIDTELAALLLPSALDKNN